MTALWSRLACWAVPDRALRLAPPGRRWVLLDGEAVEVWSTPSGIRFGRAVPRKRWGSGRVHAWRRLSRYAPRFVAWGDPRPRGRCGS